MSIYGYWSAAVITSTARRPSTWAKTGTSRAMSWPAAGSAQQLRRPEQRGCRWIAERLKRLWKTIDGREQNRSNQRSVRREEESADLSAVGDAGLGVRLHGVGVV